MDNETTEVLQAIRSTSCNKLNRFVFISTCGFVVRHSFDLCNCFQFVRVLKFLYPLQFNGKNTNILVK